MSVTVVYANAVDSYISAHSSSLGSAQDGANPYVESASGTTVYVGQGWYGSYWYVKEAFESFTFSPAANEHVVSAHVRLASWSYVQETLELRKYDWGTGVGTSDWRTRAQLTAATLYGAVTDCASTGVATGTDDLLTDVRAGGTVYMVGCTTDQRTGVTPSSSSDYIVWYTADYSGTAYDPALVYSSVPESTLHHVLGAQVALSDGTWAVLDTDGDPDAPVVTLVHVNAALSPTTIATLSTGTGSAQFGYPAGAQGYALAVDDEDNLYVLGKVGNTTNSIAAQAFSYSAGTWTAQAVRTAALPTCGSAINQVVAAWHDVGTSGTLVALAAHGYVDPGAGTACAYMLIDCSYLLTGSGSMLRGSGNAETASLTRPGFGTSMVNDNSAGSQLDVAQSSSTRGYAISAYPIYDYPAGGSLGKDALVFAARYIPASDGASLSVKSEDRGDFSLYVDSQAKARVIAVNDTRMLLIAADPDDGITVEDVQNIGTSSTFSRLGLTSLDGEVASMPSASTLASAATWDATYDAVANKVYVYYFDTADGRRLMRTSVDLSTHFATGEEEEIDDAVGAVGSTNLAIRASRGDRPGEATLITVANRSSGGTLSTIYAGDSANIAPTPPTLTAHANFDATSATTFYWTFEDPNTGDTQSAYQLQIDVVGGSNVVDTTKTSSSDEYYDLAGSTISNDEDFQWRVKTWDAADEEGEWSEWSTFTTASTGTVTITDPVSDNPEWHSSSYQVDWYVSGITQDHYRVVVINTVTSGTALDTGWVASTDTTYLITGMATDIQYRIEVTAQESGVDTNTDVALLTPDFGTPETPTLTITAVDDEAYALATVANPTPTGSRPEAARNDILRRPYGSTGAYTIVTTTQSNGTGRDYSGGASVSYEYIARAQAAEGYSDSPTVVGLVWFRGLWINDPLDAEDTSRQFPYGRAQHSSSAEREHVETHYAGRELPVVDYGDQRTETFSVKIDVPYGATWRDDLDALAEFAIDQRVLTVRDARGRAVTGSLSNYKVSDQRWGTQVSFTMTRTSDELVTV